MKQLNDKGFESQVIAEKLLNKKSQIDVIIVERNADERCDLVVGIFLFVLRGEGKLPRKGEKVVTTASGKSYSLCPLIFMCKRERERERERERDKK